MFQSEHVYRHCILPKAKNPLDFSKTLKEVNMFFQWYLYCFRKFFTFSGRASRTEYWSFTIINMIVMGIFYFISMKVDPPSADGQPVVQSASGAAIFFGTLYLLYCFAIVLPLWSVTVRRLHDRDHTGLWVLGSFIPLLNIVVFIMTLLPSQPFANRYGLRAPQSPTDEVPIVPPNYYGAYGALNYQTGQNMNKQNAQQSAQSTTNVTAQEGSVLDEMMKEDLAVADTQAGIEAKDQSVPSSNTPTHRPMGASESSLVARLKKMSGKS